MNYTLLLDIEGTITDNRGFDGKHTDVLQGKLRGLESSGVNIIFCSGRDLKYIQNLKRVWGLNISRPIIAENGCVVFDGITELATFDRSKYPHSAIQKRLAETKLFEMAELDSAKRHVITIYPMGFSLGVEYTQQQVQDIYDLVRSELAEFELSITYSSASVDIMPRGVDKLFGLKVLIGKENIIAPPNCMYIGDSKNDLEIGKFIHGIGGLFCVPGNGLTELKLAADHVENKEFDGGVLEIIERFDI